MPVKTQILELKLKEGSKFYEFVEWFVDAKSETNPSSTNPAKMRTTKGNPKRWFITQMELMLTTGEVSDDFADVIKEFKSSIPLTKEMLQVKKVMGDVKFQELLEKMEQAKGV